MSGISGSVGSVATDYSVPAGLGVVATITPATVTLTGTRVDDGTVIFAANAFGSAGTINTGVGSTTLTLGGSGSVPSANITTPQALTLGTLALANGTGLASDYAIASTGNTGTINQAAAAVSTLVSNPSSPVQQAVQQTTQSTSQATAQVITTAAPPPLTVEDNSASETGSTAPTFVASSSSSAPSDTGSSAQSGSGSSTQSGSTSSSSTASDEKSSSSDSKPAQKSTTNKSDKPAQTAKKTKPAVCR